MGRALSRLILVALGLAWALGGCAASPLVDQLPANMGLPSGTPARPATPYQYPAVHDMPPARATAPLNEDELLKLENDLKAARDRQEGRPAGGSAPAKKSTSVTDKKPAPVPKKPPSNTIIVPPPGANGSGTKTNP